MLSLRDKLGLVPIHPHPEWHTLIFTCLVGYKGERRQLSNLSVTQWSDPFTEPFVRLRWKLPSGWGKPAALQKRDGRGSSPG
jgi:hypothetical protein